MDESEKGGKKKRRVNIRSCLAKKNTRGTTCYANQEIAGFGGGPPRENPVGGGGGTKTPSGILAVVMGLGYGMDGAPPPSDNWGVGKIVVKNKQSPVGA